MLAAAAVLEFGLPMLQVDHSFRVRMAAVFGCDASLHKQAHIPRSAHCKCAPYVSRLQTTSAAMNRDMLMMLGARFAKGQSSWLL